MSIHSEEVEAIQSFHHLSSDQVPEYKKASFSLSDDDLQRISSKIQDGWVSRPKEEPRSLVEDCVFSGLSRELKRRMLAQFAQEILDHWEYVTR
ncbi:MAG: hypothetical protein OXD42_05085 [Rhodospirillaceae bacterium]|nr:hypothetical protein [Rhodospirillaceae bacterium]